MQKKLIALAVAGLGLSGAAFAQSNVTVYGIFDASFESVKASGAAAAGANRESFSRVSSNSSYIGFKGTEEIDGGLKAIFQIESGFSGDTAGALAGGRDYFVGLTGGWGSIRLGNLTGPTRAIGTALDLLPGRAGIGTSESLLARGVNSTGGTATLFDSRTGNAVFYTSPSVNGFTGSALYSTGEDKTNTAATSATEANGKQYELGLSYAAGPWYAAYAWAKRDYGTSPAAARAANSLLEWKSSRLGIGYTFEPGHKVNFIWDKQDQDVTKAAGRTGDLQKSAWSLQGLYKLNAASSLVGAYTKSQEASGNYLTTNSDTGAKLWTLAYLYSLSKRTTVKAVWTKITNENNVGYDFSNNGTQGAGATSWGNGADPQGISVGIRHSF
jgi:predicted porin